jgi:hypothetical protein
MGLFSGIFGGGGSAPKYKFKPTTITTGTGSGSYNPKTGAVSSGLDPQLQQLQDYFYNQALGINPEQAQQFAGQVSGYGQGLFGQAANLDTQQMAQDYYRQQQQLLAPDRAQEEARLAETLFRTGRTGVAQGVEGGYVNPEQFALLRAREMQNAQLALGAEDRARQIQEAQLKNALGFYGAGQEFGMQPYAQQAQLLGYGGTIAGMENQLLAQLQGFGGLTNQAQAAKYQADLAAYNAGQSPGLFGNILGGIGMAAAGPVGGALGSWLTSSLTSPTTASTVAPMVASGYGGYANQNYGYGSGPSTLLGGNAILPNYSIGPTWR